MLYQLHEMNRTLLSPLVQWAEASSKLFTNPVSPFAHTPFAQRIAAGYELMFRLGKEYEKPAFGITSVEVEGQRAAVIEDVVLEKPFCKLLHFRNAANTRPKISRLKVWFSGQITQEALVKPL